MKANFSRTHHQERSGDLIILESDSSLTVDLITNDKVIIDKNYNLIMQARYFLAKD
jgi:hypothetical protein